MKANVSFKYYTDVKTTGLVADMVDHYNRDGRNDNKSDKSVRMHEHDFAGTTSFFVCSSLFGFLAKSKKMRTSPFNNELNLKLRLQ